MHLNQNTIRNVVGILGNIISCGLFLSPMPTFIRIIKNKDVQQFSPVPYLSMLLNCMLWFLYALPFIHPNSLLILTINAIGLVFESTYLFIFFIYAKREGRVICLLKVLKILAVEIVFMTVVVVLVLLLTHTTTKRSFIVGILCIIFGTCMYASPLVVMKLVIQTKSVEYMPFTLSLVSFINAVFWTTYGLLPFDINVLIPNGLGVILAFAQLVLYACYYRSTPKREDNAAEIELSV